MVLRAGLCVVCGKATESLRTCAICGALVCGSDFNENVGICARCAGRARARSADRFERRMP
ncbi:MAG TPA: hypothetical protein VJB16_07560 [archaeon]|nr:hypothetical protein [archaeon]